ncbi:MAG TPA: ABC transporter ATP-binding protein [Intrasporangium sp.]|uniref:ABC transporter ATP-binding protein n=1 Tax=Intrasporangium sp. TaxID=1925024 RepID=UPI002F945638
MFVAENITVRFGGVVAVDDVSIRVDPGSVVGLVGPNGSGKTTFLNAATGVVPATGKLRINAHEIPLGDAGRIRRAGLGRTFQTPQSFAELSVLENVLLGSSDRRRAGFWASTLARPAMAKLERERHDKAMAALDLVGLAYHADTEVETLSYGQSRYVEFARVMAGDPEVLLMDEPSAGLNTEETSDLADFVLRARNRGVAVIVVDHKIEYLSRVCDRIDVLQTGRLIASGAPDQVFNDPVVVDAYLGV